MLLNAARGLDEHPPEPRWRRSGSRRVTRPPRPYGRRRCSPRLLPRPRGTGEADLSAVAAPDETAVFFCRTGAADETAWIGDFEPVPSSGAGGTGLARIDHIALTQPYDRFDEASLFFRCVLGLPIRHSSEIAAPFGLVRNRTAANADGRSGSE